MAMNPLCYPVVMITVLLAQLAVLMLKMQVCTVMDRLLNLLQPYLLQVCVVWVPENCCLVSGP